MYGASPTYEMCHGIIPQLQLSFIEPALGVHARNLHHLTLLRQVVP